MTYLDHNATTPLAQGLNTYIRPYLEEEFGNPSSVSYALGQRARHAVDKARVEVAEFIDAKPEEIVFTSGGTESISLAILGIASEMQKGEIIFRSSVEHPAVNQSIDFCVRAFGIEEKVIPVTKSGALNLDNMFNSPENSSQAKLMSVMLANNETGIVHNIKFLRSIVHRDILLHVDATQAIGKIPFSFKKLNIDLCSFSAHKFGGPKGVGVLVVKNGLAWNSPVTGGGQEGGRRGGTENVALIAGLGYAVKASKHKLENNYTEKLSELRDYFEEQLVQSIAEVEIIGKKSPRLPNTCNALIPGIVSANLVKYLGEKGICISAGSACKASSFSPSPVLSAMGYSSVSSVSAIRVSFGDGNTKEDADLLVNEIVKFCKENNKIEDLIR